MQSLLKKGSRVGFTRIRGAFVLVIGRYRPFIGVEEGFDGSRSNKVLHGAKA